MYKGSTPPSSIRHIQYKADEFLVNDLNASVFCHRGGDFQSVQEASRVTVSKSDEDFLGLFIYFKARILSFKSSLKQLF